jgi:hypothetical protein
MHHLCRKIPHLECFSRAAFWNWKCGLIFQPYEVPTKSSALLRPVDPCAASPYVPSRATLRSKARSDLYTCQGLVRSGYKGLPVIWILRVICLVHFRQLHLDSAHMCDVHRCQGHFSLIRHRSLKIHVCDQKQLVPRARACRREHTAQDNCKQRNVQSWWYIQNKKNKPCRSNAKVTTSACS